MKKKYLPYLSFLACGLVLTGCGAVNNGLDRSVEVFPDEIKLNLYSANIFAEETIQLETFVFPAKSSGAKLTWSSSDSSVARVDNNGRVTGIAPGTAKIKVTFEKDDYLIESECVVRVTTKLRKGNDLYKKLDNAKATQESLHPKGFDKVRVIEVRTENVYKNDVMITSTIEYTEYLLSKSEGYFSICGKDIETKCEDGSKVYTDYSWRFITDEDFNTHLYHESDNQKNVLHAATQSFLGQPRVEVTYSILDSLFSSGRAIMTSRYDDVTGLNRLEYAQLKSNIDYGWTNGDDIVGYQLSSSYDDTWDYNSERYYDIPYIEETMDVSFTEKNTWVNGVVRTQAVTQDIIYEFEGDKYKDELIINYTFDIDDEVELFYPNNSEYNVVDELYDL